MRYGRLLFYLVLCSVETFPALAVAPVTQDGWRQKTASEAATVSKFVAACDRDAFQCEYKMRMAVLNKVNTRDATSICITDVRPRERVVAWLRAHPETSKMETEDGLYKAYVSLYPCS